MSKIKYPRTPHLSISPGFSSDDVYAPDDALLGQEVVITEKLDGENSTLYANGDSHARSMDSRSHVSRDWLKKFWGERHWNLPQPENDNDPLWRVCGENVFAQHSIAYNELKTFFYGFSVWSDQNLCLSWDDTLRIFQCLDIEPVPVLYEGVLESTTVPKLIKTLDLTKVEGLVVRKRGQYNFDEFGSSIAKWVRKNHVQTDDHWMSKPIVPNRLIV